MRSVTASRDQLSLVDALVQLSFTVQAMLSARGAEHDLSLTQIRLLGVLWDRRPGMQQLAAILGLDKSSASGLVDRAERRGLVRRAGSEHDGRAVTVALTPKGRRLASRLGVSVQEQVAALAAPLTKAQQRELARLVSVLLAGMQA